jgi:hypothetical protein
MKGAFLIKKLNFGFGNIAYSVKWFSAFPSTGYIFILMCRVLVVETLFGRSYPNFCFSEIPGDLLASQTLYCLTSRYE